MKKILITGAGGFIGSHLVELCLEEGCNIRAFIHYNSMNRWGWLEEVTFKDGIEVIAGDVRDYDLVYSAMQGCDTVFHLAALIGIPYSYESPLAYIKTNIEGTYNVLQAALKSKVNKVLVTSTSEVYGTAQYVPIDEKHPQQAQSPYSASKIGADKIAESFYRSFDLPVAIIRPFNTYGPRQSARAIIPTVITQLLSGKTEIMLGALYPTRDFTYVKDTVKAMTEIAKSDKVIGKVLNIATQTEISIEDIAKKLIGIINPQAKVIEDNRRLRPEKSEVERLLGSNEQIISLTNWKPNYTLDDGLKETIEWFKNKEDSGLYKSNIYNV